VQPIACYVYDTRNAYHLYATNLHCELQTYTCQMLTLVMNHHVGDNLPVAASFRSSAVHLRSSYTYSGSTAPVTLAAAASIFHIGRRQTSGAGNRCQPNGSLSVFARLLRMRAARSRTVARCNVFYRTNVSRCHAFLVNVEQVLGAETRFAPAIARALAVPRGGTTRLHGVNHATTCRARAHDVVSGLRGCFEDGGDDDG